MGATITCNLKPLMIKSSFIHDCAPQSLGPITFFFSLSQIHTFGMISACGTRIIKSRGEWLTKRIVNFLARLSFLWLYTTSTVWISEHSWESKSLKGFFSSALENSTLSHWKKKLLSEVWALAVILIKRRLRLLSERFGRNCRWGHTSSAKSAFFPGVPCMASNNQYKRAHSFSVSNIIIDSLFGSCWASFLLLRVTHYLLERELSEKLCFKYYSITWETVASLGGLESQPDRQPWTVWMI